MKLYGLDTVVVGGAEYHKSCVRCSTCDMRLTLDKVVIKDNKNYCSFHLPRTLKLLEERPNIDKEILREILTQRKDMDTICSVHRMGNIRMCDMCKREKQECRECRTCVDEVCPNANCYFCADTTFMCLKKIDEKLKLDHLSLSLKGPLTVAGHVRNKKTNFHFLFLPFKLTTKKIEVTYDIFIFVFCGMSYFCYLYLLRSSFLHVYMSAYYQLYASTKIMIIR